MPLVHEMDGSPNRFSACGKMQNLSSKIHRPSTKSTARSPRDEGPDKGRRWRGLWAASPDVSGLVTVGQPSTRRWSLWAGGDLKCAIRGGRIRGMECKARGGIPSDARPQRRRRPCRSMEEPSAEAVGLQKRQQHGGQLHNGGRHRFGVHSNQ